MRAVLLALAGICLCAAAPTLAQTDESKPRAEYSIRERTPPTGSSIRRENVRGADFALNLPYERLSAKDKAALHARWDLIREGDEPPFPENGMKSILEPIAAAQQRALERGILSLVATVNPEGQVSQVSVLETPNPALSKFAAQVLLLTKFKPAKCSGSPCQMEFPVQVSLGVSR